MKKPDLIQALAHFRRPGSPVYAGHFTHLPVSVRQPGNYAALLAILNDPSLPPGVREHAAGALGEVGDRRAVPSLLTALDSARLRRGAAVALGRLQASRAAPALKRLAPKCPAARWALGEVTVPHTVADALEDLREGQLRLIPDRLRRLSPSLRKSVEKAVVRRFHQAVAAGGPGEQDRWLITSLQELTPSRVGADLAAALDHTNRRQATLCPSIRNRLLRTISAVCPAAALPALAVTAFRGNSPVHARKALLSASRIAETVSPASLQRAIDSVPRGIRGRLRRHLQILLLGVVLSGCQDLTTSPREFEIPPTPMLADDGLQVSSLAAQGIDPQSIARLAWEIRHGHFEEIHSLVIVRHGHLVFEEYFADDHHIDYQHRLASVTKSVISVVVGTAVQQGFIAGHEQPLHELFPDEIDIFADHPEKRRLLLRHALTMSAGLRWKEGIGGQQGSDSYALDNSFDSMRFALERPIDEAPGEAFAYNDGLTNLLVGAVINSSGLDFEEYAEEHLFGRLGIGNYSWEHQRDGGIRAGGGLHLTNRDLAKIGLLCLQNGVWSGERLLPDDWMELSTRKWIDTHQGHHYGFQWWLQPHAGMPGFLIDSEGGYFGSGYAGQKLFILPEHDLVVASFGSDYELDTDADHAVPHFVLYNILSSLTD
ncbi:MAG TPA: serine hydrolase [Candidatus Latescibacteria bacterium]|nr:hypothetical protein [Gemmatimonadaceae bacterium]HJP31972.1 serine hydrolase [Candidatus Latescibacterota bacterium]